MAEAESVPAESTEPAQVDASTELFTLCRTMAKHSFLLTLHKDYPNFAELLGDRRGQQWFFANRDMGSWAEFNELPVGIRSWQALA